MSPTNHRWCVIALVVLPWLAARAGAAESVSLFARTDQPHPPTMAIDEFSLRDRLVTVNLGELQRVRTTAISRQGDMSGDEGEVSRAPDSASKSQTTLTLNLFDDVAVNIIVEHTAPTFSGGYSLAGRVRGDPSGSVALVVNDGRVVGRVRTREGTYRIRSVGQGQSRISEVVEPPLDCRAEPPHTHAGPHH